MKGKIAVIIVSVAAVAAVVAAALFVNYYTNSDRLISFDAQSNGETLEFSCDNMYPGEVRTSDYQLKSEFSGELILTFVSGTQGDLVPYLNTEVSVGGSSVYSGPLQSVMESSLTADIPKGGAKFSVSFWIDIDTENQAQGLGATVCGAI